MGFFRSGSPARLQQPGKTWASLSDLVRPWRRRSGSQAVFSSPAAAGGTAVETPPGTEAQAGRFQAGVPDATAGTAVVSSHPCPAGAAEPAKNKGPYIAAQSSSAEEPSCAAELFADGAATSEVHAHGPSPYRLAAV